jgi:hypothetical protein
MDIPEPPDPRHIETISSAEFRKTYAKLRKQVYVTALGRVIGHWIPTNSATYVAGIKEVYGLQPPPGAEEREPDPERDPVFRFGVDERYDTRPIRPVPKTGVRDLR